MTSHHRTSSHGASTGRGKITAGASVAILMAVTAHGQGARANAAIARFHSRVARVAVPYLSAKAVRHPRDSRCSPTMTATPGSMRCAASAADKVQRLTLDCNDSAGNPSVYSADLTSGDTFASRPVNLANERGSRPARAGRRSFLLYAIAVDPGRLWAAARS